MSASATSVSTRERLMDVAERRFAEAGFAAVTTREIVEAAGQRNTSAISYHFGSRDGLVTAILVRRGAPIDERRAQLRAELDTAREQPLPARELVRCLIVPYAAMLQSEGGRSYVRLVAQFRGRFAAWRVESDAATTVELARIMDDLERSMDTTAALRRERIVALIMLMTSSIAERARTLDAQVEPELDHDAYLEVLIDMCTSLVKI